MTTFPLRASGLGNLCQERCSTCGGQGAHPGALCCVPSWPIWFCRLGTSGQWDSPSPGASWASLRLAPAGSPWEVMSSELHFPPLQEELISIARRRLQQLHLYWGGSGLLSPLPRAPVISYQTGLRWQGTQSRHVWESRTRIPHQEAEPRWDWWSPGTLRRRLRVSFPLCPLTRLSA